MFSKLKNLLTAKASGEAKPDKESLAARLDALLAQGQLGEAFELMKESGHSEVAPLQLQWHTARQQLAEKRIAIEAFNRTQNRLACALREMAPAPPAAQAGGETKPNKESLAARLDALLAQGQLGEAFELMKESGHSEVALLQLQWHTARQQLAEKRIAIEAFNRTQNRLANAMREMAQAPGRNGVQGQPLPQETRARALAPPPVQAAIDPLKRSAAIDLLAQSRFQEALELLQHAGPNWQSLLERYNLLQRNERLGVISAADYKQASEELERQLVQWVEGLEKTGADQPAAIGFMRPSRETWQRAAAEVEAGNWQEAIVIGQRWDASWLLLFSRLQRVIRDRQNGLATATDVAEALEGIKWSFEDLWAEEAKKWG